VRLRVLTVVKRMPPGDALAGFGEGLRTGRRDEKTREENPHHIATRCAHAGAKTEANQKSLQFSIQTGNNFLNNAYVKKINFKHRRILINLCFRSL